MHSSSWLLYSFTKSVIIFSHKLSWISTVMVLTTKLQHGKRQALSLLVMSHSWITFITWVLSCVNFKTRPLQSLMWWWSRMVLHFITSKHCVVQTGYTTPRPLSGLYLLAAPFCSTKPSRRCCVTCCRWICVGAWVSNCGSDLQLVLHAPI